jgi:pyruvate,water dikinase
MAAHDATPPTPQPIPLPPDFPFTWERPEDQSRLLTIDQMHFPGQIKPLTATLVQLFDRGFNGASDHYSLPVEARTLYINTYLYQSLGPRLLPPEQLHAMGEQAEARVGAALERLRELWETEWLPEILEHEAFWATFDLHGASQADLAAHFDDTIERIARLWEIHFLIVIPMLLGMSLFDDFYTDLFGSETRFEAMRLMQSDENKSYEAGQELWKLSRQALALPEVRRILEEAPAAEVVPALEQSEQGRNFLAPLRGWLDVYGRRGSLFANYDDPSWIEDPTPAIKSLKDYVGQADRDMEAERREQMAAREQLLTDARTRLQGYPEQVRGQFEFFVNAGQLGAMLQENHNYYLDQRTLYYAPRRVVMEIGRRLAAAGQIDRPDDIFSLTHQQVQAALHQPTVPDLRGQVADWQAALQRWSQVEPPRAIGSMPPGPPPDSPLGRAVGKFFGGPPQPPTDPNVLRGNAGSPGTVRAPARVVHSLAEAGALRRGEVLVTETTAPSWTPLFATAAAVVTDTGGILSHCAIVAREYSIPAVVGVGMATAMIQTGQIIEVDGDNGIIRIVT